MHPPEKHHDQRVREAEEREAETVGEQVLRKRMEKTEMRTIEVEDEAAVVETEGHPMASLSRMEELG